MWLRNQNGIVKHLNIAVFGKHNETGRRLWKEKRIAYYEMEYRYGKLTSAEMSLWKSDCCPNFYLIMD